MMVFLNLAQGYTVIVSVEFYTDSMYLWCIGSTVAFCLNEIQSFQPRIVVIFLQCRQLVMWHLAFSFAVPSTSSTVVFRLAALGLVMVYFMSSKMRDKAKESWGFFFAVRQEREKLRLVLEAIPEGLVVVSAELKVLCHNKRLWQAIGAPSGIDLDAALKSIICKKENEEQRLLNEISLFLRVSKESLITFGVSTVGDYFYEWKGTKCLWENSEACILTASDISS